jgi:hypothetical protein
MIWILGGFLIDEMMVNENDTYMGAGHFSRGGGVQNFRGGGKFVDPIYLFMMHN